MADKKQIDATRLPNSPLILKEGEGCVWKGQLYHVGDCINGSKLGLVDAHAVCTKWGAWQLEPGTDCP